MRIGSQISNNIRIKCYNIHHAVNVSTPLMSFLQTGMRVDETEVVLISKENIVALGIVFSLLLISFKAHNNKYYEQTVNFQFAHLIWYTWKCNKYLQLFQTLCIWWSFSHFLSLQKFFPSLSFLFLWSNRII